MSEAVQIAAFLLVAGAIATIAKLLWDHIQHCKDVHSKLAEIGGDVKRLQQDIGTHETGMRGTLHKTANAVTALADGGSIDGAVGAGSMSFERAFDMVIGHEGGLVDNPADPGGLTKYGISQRAYPGEDIRNLTMARAQELYRRDYWNPIKGDQLPPPLAICLFDMAVNSGVSQAVRTLQKAIDVPVDGLLGPGTLGKALSLPTTILVAYMQAERVLFMSKLPEFATFGRGWARRVISTAIEACS